MHVLWAMHNVFQFGVMRGRNNRLTQFDITNDPCKCLMFLNNKLSSQNSKVSS